MTRVIKLSKGLDINLAGKAEPKKVALSAGNLFALKPSDFEGVKPKVVVKEGEKVKAGDALFVNKDFPQVKFASPVSGTVKLVERGDRRKLLSVQVEADAQQEFVDFGKKDVKSLDAQAVKDALLDAGLFGYINQLPYAISTNPETAPKAIFVSAFRDMPLAGDFSFELKGQEADFQTGLSALAKIAKVYVGVNESMNLSDVEVVEFRGKCPAGNVGVQVNNIDPVNKGEVVWTVEPSEMKENGYVDALVGQQLTINAGANARVIMGNPLTGKAIATTQQASAITVTLGAHVSEITAIPEGNNADEILGWIMPRFGQFSVNRSYFSWLFGKKQYKLDARVKGGERHMIMSGEYDSVLPMDIYGEYLIKAIITGDIDKQEQLGIYEVSPEDFALAEFVDSSKLELQRIVREGLDVLRKENE